MKDRKAVHRPTALALATLVLLGAGGVGEGAGGWSGYALAQAFDFAFEPVSYQPPDASIRLSVIGSYRNGFFSNSTPAGPPAYDPKTSRIFVGSGDRSEIDAIDISDPSAPVKAFGIDLSPYGGEANALALHKGVLAATTKDVANPGHPGWIVFWNADGDVLSAAQLRAGLSRIAFTPDGRTVVVTVSASPNDDYTIDPEGGVLIVDVANINWGACKNARDACRIETHETFLDFRPFNDEKDELAASGVRFVGPNATVAQDLETSGLAVSNDSRYAFVNLATNNAWAEIDLRQKVITRIIPYGYKDNSIDGNGIDASDKDQQIKIRTWPIRSWYMPKDVASYTSRGRRFILTANEGNLVDLSGWTEVARLKNLPLDEGTFPNAAVLKQDVNLGRLDFSRLYGDEDGDGNFDALYTGGARSFSIFTQDGNLVFDSGDDFEQITAAAIPSCFNCPEDSNQFDARSRKKGPEPEHVVVGEVRGRSYAFVSFERIGGFIVYDVTDPRAVSFQQYINNRNFAVDPLVVCGKKGSPPLDGCDEKLGDSEPEGITFISASESPINVPLVVVLHEASDSTTVYRVDSVDGDQ